MNPSSFLPTQRKKTKTTTTTVGPCNLFDLSLFSFLFLLLGSCTVSPSSVITHERGNYALLPFCCDSALCPLCSGPEPSTCPIRNQSTSSLSCSPSYLFSQPLSRYTLSSISGTVFISQHFPTHTVPVLVPDSETNIDPHTLKSVADWTEKPVMSQVWGWGYCFPIS